jgi:hypothetical protein
VGVDAPIGHLLAADLALTRWWLLSSLRLRTMTSTAAALASPGSTVPTQVSMGRPLALVIRIIWLVGIFEAPNSELRSGDAA